MLKTKLAFNSDISPSYANSNGVKLIDHSGNSYFDLFLNYSSLPFGHSFPPLNSFLESNIPSLSERPPLCAFNCKEVSLFADKLYKSFPDKFDYLSFAENGGLAIEQVVKSFLYLASIANITVNF